MGPTHCPKSRVDVTFHCIVDKCGGLQSLLEHLNQLVLLDLDGNICWSWSANLLWERLWAIHLTGLTCESSGVEVGFSHPNPISMVSPAPERTWPWERGTEPLPGLPCKSRAARWGWSASPPWQLLVVCRWLSKLSSDGTIAERASFCPLRLEETSRWQSVAGPPVCSCWSSAFFPAGW